MFGQVDDPWLFISRADALLLPSQWEGMPNVALEALALGFQSLHIAVVEDC